MFPPSEIPQKNHIGMGNSVGGEFCGIISHVIQNSTGFSNMNKNYAIIFKTSLLSITLFRLEAYPEINSILFYYIKTEHSTMLF